MNAAFGRGLLPAGVIIFLKRTAVSCQPQAIEAIRFLRIVNI